MIPSCDTTNGLRLTGGHGAVSTDLRILKPLPENLKTVYSPLNNTARESSPAGGQCAVPLQNRHSFTDISELIGRWQPLAIGESHIAAKPLSTVEASFPGTPGMDALCLEFIHSDGRTVYLISLPIKN